MPLNHLQLFGPHISLQMFAVAASGQQKQYHTIHFYQLSCTHAALHTNIIQ